MPRPTQVVLGALLISLLVSVPLFAYEPPAAKAPRPFQYETDTFAFANETVWNYANGSVQSDSSKTATQKRNYTRRCFVVARAAVQFWKFARFEPEGKPLPREQLAARIREVTERSVWLPALAPDQRVVFPAYHHLRDISEADPAIFQANIGLGWPIYFRPGNAPIALPLYRETEAKLNDEIFHDLGMNYPTIVWLYNFPSLSINHVVVVFNGKRQGHRYLYDVYDPNYSTGAQILSYNSKTRTFTYLPTFYFPGGTVDVRAVYRGVLQ